MTREDKRNAMFDGLMAEIERFSTLQKEVRVVILHGRGVHYCSGHLAEHVAHSARQQGALRRGLKGQRIIRSQSR